MSRKNTIAGQMSHPLTDHDDGDQAQEHGARAGNGGPRARRLGHSKSVGEDESVRARSPCHGCGDRALGAAPPLPKLGEGRKSQSKEGWRNKKMSEHPKRVEATTVSAAMARYRTVRRRLAHAGSSAALGARRVWSCLADAVPEGAKCVHVAACNAVRVPARSPRRCRCLTACARVAAGHGQQGGLCC